MVADGVTLVGAIQDGVIQVGVIQVGVIIEVRTYPTVQVGEVATTPEVIMVLNLEDEVLMPTQILLVEEVLTLLITIQEDRLLEIQAPEDRLLALEIEQPQSIILLEEAVV